MSRALVISGGGSKGAYAVGVLKRLFREYPGLHFDMIVGTSTGSLIAPLVALNQMPLLEQLYTTQVTSNIVLLHRLGDRIANDSIFDSQPLAELMVRHYTDALYAQLVASPTKIYLTTTCLQSEELVVFTTEPNPASSKYYEISTLQNGSHFRRAVMASASQPVFMSPVKVNEKIAGEAHPNYQFVDGGVREYAGVQMAIDNGATEIFTILLSSGLPVAETVEYKALFPILEKTIAIFTEDVGRNDLIIPSQFNEALQYIEAVKNKMKRNGMTTAEVTELFKIKGKENPYEDKVPLKLYTFRPETGLGGGPGGLTFNPAEMKEMLAKGESSANDFIASLDPTDVTWA